MKKVLFFIVLFTPVLFVSCNKNGENTLGPRVSSLVFNREGAFIYVDHLDGSKEYTSDRFVGKVKSIITKEYSDLEAFPAEGDTVGLSKYVFSCDTTKYTKHGILKNDGFKFDRKGRLSKVFFDDGSVTSFKYDKNGALLKKIIMNNDTLFSEINFTHYVKDGILWEEGVEAKSGDIQKASYKYDENGRLVEKTIYREKADASRPNRKKIFRQEYYNVYNADGKLVQDLYMKDSQKELSSVYNYQGDSILIEKTFRSLGQLITLPVFVRYYYDEKGNWIRQDINTINTVPLRMFTREIKYY